MEPFAHLHTSRFFRCLQIDSAIVIQDKVRCGTVPLTTYVDKVCKALIGAATKNGYPAGEVAGGLFVKPSLSLSSAHSQ